MTKRDVIKSWLTEGANKEDLVKLIEDTHMELACRERLANAIMDYTRLDDVRVIMDFIDEYKEGPKPKTKVTVDLNGPELIDLKEAENIIKSFLKDI